MVFSYKLFDFNQEFGIAFLISGLVGLATSLFSLSCLIFVCCRRRELFAFWIAFMLQTANVWDLFYVLNNGDLAGNARLQMHFITLY